MKLFSALILSLFLTVAGCGDSKKQQSTDEKVTEGNAKLARVRQIVKMMNTRGIDLEKSPSENVSSYWQSALGQSDSKDLLNEVIAKGTEVLAISNEKNITWSEDSRALMQEWIANAQEYLKHIPPPTTPKDTSKKQDEGEGSSTPPNPQNVEIDWDFNTWKGKVRLHVGNVEKEIKHFKKTFEIEIKAIHSLNDDLKSADFQAQINSGYYIERLKEEGNFRQLNAIFNWTKSQQDNLNILRSLDKHIEYNHRLHEVEHDLYLNLGYARIQLEVIGKFGVRAGREYGEQLLNDLKDQKGKLKGYTYHSWFSMSDKGLIQIPNKKDWNDTSHLEPNDRLAQFKTFEAKFKNYLVDVNETCRHLGITNHYAKVFHTDEGRSCTEKLHREFFVLNKLFPDPRNQFRTYEEFANWITKYNQIIAREVMADLTKNLEAAGIYFRPPFYEISDDLLQKNAERLKSEAIAQIKAEDRFATELETTTAEEIYRRVLRSTRFRRSQDYMRAQKWFNDFFSEINDPVNGTAMRLKAEHLDDFKNTLWDEGIAEKIHMDTISPIPMFRIPQYPFNWEEIQKELTK